MSYEDCGGREADLYRLSTALTELCLTVDAATLSRAPAAARWWKKVGEPQYKRSLRRKREAGDQDELVRSAKSKLTSAELDAILRQ
jgi:hypothetical protein